MKIYTEVVIDMNTCDVVSEESFDYDGPMVMCGGKPGNDDEWDAAQKNIDMVNSLGDNLTSSFESMQKQFNAMDAVYGEQKETAGNRYALAGSAMRRANDKFQAETGEGGYIDRALGTAESQYEQAGERQVEQSRQAGTAVSAAIRGTGEKSRRAATKASSMARSQAARSGLAGAGSQGADLSDLYRDSAMATTATGEGYKKAMFASGDAYKTAGYTMDAATLAADKATFGAGQTRDASSDAYTEAGYAKDTAMQNIEMNTAQMTGKMEQDIQSMLTSFYQATDTEYGSGVAGRQMGETGAFFFNNKMMDVESDYTEFDETTITGG